MTYAEMLAEVNTLTAQKYIAKKATPKGGTIEMKKLLTKWGIAPHLYTEMETTRLYKAIGLGESKCIRGFWIKQLGIDIAGDGYGLGKSVDWLMEVEEEAEAEVEAEQTVSGMFWAAQDKPNAIYGQESQSLSNEQAQLLMKMGVEAVLFNGYGGSSRWSKSQAQVEIARLIKTKRAAAAAKGAATKAAKKAGNK